MEEMHGGAYIQEKKADIKVAPIIVEIKLMNLTMKSGLCLATLFTFLALFVILAIMVDSLEGIPYPLLLLLFFSFLS